MQQATKNNSRYSPSRSEPTQYLLDIIMHIINTPKDTPIHNPTIKANIFQSIFYNVCSVYNYNPTPHEAHRTRTFFLEVYFQDKKTSGKI